MASPTIDKIVQGNVVMHDHSESDLGVILDTRYLKLDGSNADQKIDINSQDLTTTGDIVGGNLNIDDWNTAYGWGNHALAGYLTSYTETDPIFSASEASSITSTDTSHWDTAYGWGNHASAGYLTSSDQYWVRNSLASGIMSPKTTSDDLFTTFKFYDDVWSHGIWIKDSSGNIRWFFHPTYYSTVLGSWAYPNALAVIGSTNQAALLVQPYSASSSDNIQIRDKSGVASLRQDFQNKTYFSGSIFVGGNVNGLPSFNRLAGINKRGAVTASGGVFGFYPDYLFTGNVGSPQARYPVDTTYTDYIEIDFNPFIGYTANTATGFTYIGGSLVFNFYTSRVPTNIRIDAYRYSGGSDSWTTWATITGNTATNLVYQLPESFNYLKKIRIYAYNTSVESWISNISYFPSVPQAGSKEKEYLSKYSDLEEEISAPKWTFKSSSWATIGKFEPRVTDGSAAVAWLFDTGNSLSTSGAKIASFKNASTEKAYIDKDGIIYGAGGIKPVSMADASAPNDCIYYSTTASKLVYKDSGSTVHALY